MGDAAVLAHPAVGLLLDDGPATPQDRSGDTRPVLQMPVGGIDNGVGLFGGNIPEHKL